MFSSFLRVHATFSGYTEIALGSALVFGIKLPENFKNPFLALSIQEFWQRWHLSLSSFITRNIYLPILLKTKKRRLTLFSAFTIVGLWHNFSLNYLFWGMGHGLALVVHGEWVKSEYRKSILKNPSLHLAWSFVAWLLTMSCVSYLSMFANLPTFSDSVNFTLSLCGVK